MNIVSRTTQIALVALALASAALPNRAGAQRVRFASRERAATSQPRPQASQDGWVSSASRYVSNSPTPPGLPKERASEPVEAASTAPEYSTVDEPVYVGSTASLASRTASASQPTPTVSYNTTPIHSPAASYGASVSPPVAVVAGWDPYQVASRHAAFSGTVVSNPGMPGQFTLPQPMPRVPYYTQQPVSGGAQPYVVIPEAGCETPMMPMAAPGVVPTTTPAYVPPSNPGWLQPPVAAPMAIPPTVPTLPGPLAAPPPLASPFASPFTSTRNCYAQADAIFFTRDTRLGNTPLVLLDGNLPTQSNVLLSTADLDFNFQPGPRILLGTEFGGFRAFEATYFGIYNWNTSSTIVGEDDLNMPGDLATAPGTAFFEADTATVNYTSDLHNAEFNCLRYYGNIAWLAGFRYLNLGEQFGMQFTDDVDGLSVYNVSAYNNLFGGQIGGRVRQACGNWSYDLTGKAGVYGNAVRSSQWVTDTSGDAIRNTENSTTDLAFIGELGLSGYYRFSQCLSLRGGYQVFWIEGVALAPEQLDFTNTASSGTTLNTSGGVFMHGAHAGLMAEW